MKTFGIQKVRRVGGRVKLMKPLGQTLPSQSRYNQAKRKH